MKLTTYAWIMALVVFVGTLPHAVGAMFIRTQIEVAERCTKPIMLVSVAEMKKLAQYVAKGKVMAMYHSKKEWQSLHKLWMKESRWDYTANNPDSTAFGIPQILGMPENTPMIKQIDLGLKYIQHRYGTPTKALAFHNRNGWY